MYLDININLNFKALHDEMYSLFSPEAGLIYNETEIRHILYLGFRKLFLYNIITVPPTPQKNSTCQYLDYKPLYKYIRNDSKLAEQVVEYIKILDSHLEKNS